ncbi:type II toxin-antitoxin system RelE family toxin [Methanoculleus bourgensis]|uniref:type II toxin-antitoxin system RelE family toxin n=1 Tax=Methanoculleus bourgensis TaxID=83986 RepID=UPI003B9225F7
MTFRLMVDKRALDFLNSLEAKDQRIIKEKLKILQENPYPGSDGDKEKLHTNKKRESYRLHVARSFTVIYNIDSDDNLVYITHIMSIEKAHRRYGRI